MISITLTDTEALQYLRNSDPRPTSNEKIEKLKEALIGKDILILQLKEQIAHFENQEAPIPTVKPPLSLDDIYAEQRSVHHELEPAKKPFPKTAQTPAKKPRKKRTVVPFTADHLEMIEARLAIKAESARVLEVLWGKFPKGAFTLPVFRKRILKLGISLTSSGNYKHVMSWTDKSIFNKAKEQL